MRASGNCCWCDAQNHHRELQRMSFGQLLSMMAHDRNPTLDLVHIKAPVMSADRQRDGNPDRQLESVRALCILQCGEEYTMSASVQGAGSRVGAD